MIRAQHFFSGNKNTVDTVPHICITDTVIERVQESKVLGLKYMYLHMRRNLEYT